MEFKFGKELIKAIYEIAKSIENKGQNDENVENKLYVGLNIPDKILCYKNAFGSDTTEYSYVDTIYEAESFIGGSFGGSVFLYKDNTLDPNKCAQGCDIGRYGLQIYIGSLDTDNEFIKLSEFNGNFNGSEVEDSDKWYMVRTKTING